MGCGKSKPADVATGNVTQKKKSFFKSVSNKKEGTNQTNPDVAAKSESTSNEDSTSASNQQQESEMVISKEDPGTQNVAGVTENVAANTEKVATAAKNVTSVTENVAGVVHDVPAITESVKAVEDVPQTDVAKEGEIVGLAGQKEDEENVAGVVQDVPAITENVEAVEDVPQTDIPKEGEVVGSTEQKEGEPENAIDGGAGEDNIEAVEGMTSHASTNSFSSARKEEETFDSVASEIEPDTASLQVDESRVVVVEEAEKVGDAATFVEMDELVEETQPEVAAETEEPTMESGTSGAEDTSNADEAKDDSSAIEVKST